MTTPLLLENTILRIVERVITIFVIYKVFVGIYLFLLQKKTSASVLVTSMGLLDYCSSLLRISQNHNVFIVLSQLACLQMQNSRFYLNG